MTMDLDFIFRASKWNNTAAQVQQMFEVSSY